jgi:hypothetical protein
MEYSMKLRMGRGLWLCALAVGGSACTGGSADNEEGGDSDFVVDNPNGAGDGSGLTGTGAGDESGGSDPSGGDSDGDDGGDDGEREVSEADIVFVEGDRLYALSATGGLSVIDASNPDAGLPVLGRHRMPGQPFEMYVEDGQVFVMLNDYGTYDWDEAEGTYTWHSSSKLVALDATNPASIASRGEFEVPGYIQDSRRVGDILYLVTFEDGYCWECEQNAPRTVVTSLDVSNPAAVQIVERLDFVNQGNDPWDWSGPRSVASNDERMYIGGIEYDNWESAHSIIDVIDISDPGGALERGASVQVAGQIESRWQMDEHEGVLRVISQPWQWQSDSPPKIETFTVVSAAEVAPLASLTMTLPRPEALMSVRFDGTRGYAITFEQTDPLFTIDLADPANPQQVGELEIPGWVHHMEPRGDRLLALGYDQEDPQGAINVSLFDVSDFANPTLISRVGFGGDWAYFAEDQNRLHKAFSILEDLGLVLVPFSGWNYDDAQGEWSCGTYSSGIQLVDWSQDSLALRGVAPSHGQARRALIHRDRLLAMSDKSVQAFDITDRDAPAARSDVALAAYVNDVAFGDGIVVRLASDWWTNETSLEVVSADDPESAEPLGRLELASLSEDFACGYSWGRDLFVHDGFAYILRESHDWGEYEEYSSKLLLDAIDVRDPAAPVWTSSVELPFELGYGGSGLGLQNEERSAMLVGDALLFTTNDSQYDGEQYVGETATIEVVSLAVPGAPEHTGTLARPDGLAHGALQRQGDEAFSWHMRPVDGDETKVRFFFDRFDVSTPTEPDAEASVNVPGQVVAYDAASDRIVTVGFQLETIPANDGNCWDHPKLWGYAYEDDVCTIAHRPLHLLQVEGDDAELLDTLDVEGEAARLTSVMATSDRLFAVVSQGQTYVGGEDDGVDDEYVPPDDTLVTITGHEGSELDEASRVVIDHGGWTSLIGTSGNRAMYRTNSGLGIVDTTDASNPTVMVTPVHGWGCYDAVVTEDAVYCPLGEYGLQVISMP